MEDIRFLIEELLCYALDRELIQKEDIFYERNRLLDLLAVEEPYPETVGRGLPCEAAFAAARALCPAESLTPEPILSKILDYAAEKGLIPENLTTWRDLLDARIMGGLTARPSEFLRAFAEAEKAGGEAGTDYFYRLSRANHYIMTERIAKNLYWRTGTPYGSLEITVNLSKPEKDPREVARLATVKSAAYPKCLLCPENVGYAGRFNHPARQNLRQLPLTLQGEEWFMQYSPYVYYNEHCIVLKGAHVPMLVNGVTFRRLFDFVDRFPHYFLGSNAGLPVVGGSILYHEHYQGGRHRFPMEEAQSLAEYRLPEFPAVSVKRVNWPLTTYRLAGADREEVCRAADRLFTVWQGFSAPEAGIVARSEENGKTVPHNTVTPIARRNAEGLYELDVVLRCNITTPERPDGLFHPAPELFHIKKENIGLIEVMGLAVLPGRLRAEMSLIAELLCGERTEAAMSDAERASLEKHHPWIDTLLAEHGTKMERAAAEEFLRDEVGTIFSRVLECCGVFKADGTGVATEARYLAECGLRKIQ